MSTETQQWDAWRDAARRFAKLCFDAGEEMGPYTMEQAQSYFWAFCADQYMIPRIEKIHSMLAQLGADEASNGFDFNDMDDRVFYIPIEDAVVKYNFKRSGQEEPSSYIVKIKAVYHHTQNRDYLWLLREDGNMIEDPVGSEPQWFSHGKRLDIRRVWLVNTTEQEDDVYLRCSRHSLCWRT